MHKKSDDLERFVNAQEISYQTALKEIKEGCKKSHWMWYIFPQIEGLGFGSTAQYYSIRNLQEAVNYLRHPVLGPRLVEISRVLLELDTNDPAKVFGYPDNLKLKSCMTLFSVADSKSVVFADVLNKFYGSAKDEATLAILNI